MHIAALIPAYLPPSPSPHTPLHVRLPGLQRRLGRAARPEQQAWEGGVRCTSGVMRTWSWVHRCSCDMSMCIYEGSVA
eukprot:10827372-Alexandrium_andersonii.AAC.1